MSCNYCSMETEPWKQKLNQLYCFDCKIEFLKQELMKIKENTKMSGAQWKKYKEKWVQRMKIFCENMKQDLLDKALIEEARCSDTISDDDQLISNSEDTELIQNNCRYQCQICDEQFAKKANFLEHFKSIHMTLPAKISRNHPILKKMRQELSNI